MKLTKEQIKQIIKEELNNVLEGAYDGPSEEKIHLFLIKHLEQNDIKWAADELKSQDIDQDQVINYSQKLLKLSQFASNVGESLPKSQHPSYHKA
jgi:hypothetical protein